MSTNHVHSDKQEFKPRQEWSPLHKPFIRNVAVKELIWI